MKPHNLKIYQSLYLAGVFTTLLNLVFARAFRLEITIFARFMIRELRTVQLLFCLYHSDVCNEGEESNGGEVSTFLSKTLSVGISERLLTTDVSVFSVLTVMR